MRRRREDERRGKEEQATDKKSNNPLLAGGEKTRKMGKNYTKPRSPSKSEYTNLLGTKYVSFSRQQPETTKKMLPWTRSSKLEINNA